MIDTRKIVKTIQISYRTQLHQIFVTGFIHRQQYEVVAIFVFCRISIEMAASCNIRLDANNRFYALFPCRFVKLNRTR